MHPKKIVIISSTRADWGLLRPLAEALRDSQGVELGIVVTNMHLSEAHGHTVREIENDGFSIAARVEMWDKDLTNPSAADVVRASSKCMWGMAEAFSQLQPDVVVILGDRYEMLAVATAATIMRIPIVHIAGGEISEGAFDDSIRHAITKLSSLHLTATEPYRQRVIQMGESPELVVNSGAIGVYNLIHEQALPKDVLEKDLGIKISHETLLVTLHPATMSERPTADSCRELLEALDNFPNSTIVFTYPNNDPEGSVIIEMIEDYVRHHEGRAVSEASLGWKRYLSMLHYVGAVVGNSSSGIVEVPSMGIPTVNVGIRQQGRIAAESVIHCADNRDKITSAIEKALSPKFQTRASQVVNPYGGKDTLNIMVNSILNADLNILRHKQFHDQPLKAEQL